MPRNVFPGYREVMIFQQVNLHQKQEKFIFFVYNKKLGDTKKLQIHILFKGFSVPRHLWHRVLTGENQFMTAKTKSDYHSTFFPFLSSHDYHTCFFQAKHSAKIILMCFFNLCWSRPIIKTGHLQQKKRVCQTKIEFSFQLVELSLRLVVMWSVPFNLNLHDSFYSVWLIPERHRVTWKNNVSMVKRNAVDWWHLKWPLRAGQRSRWLVLRDVSFKWVGGSNRHLT